MIYEIDQRIQNLIENSVDPETGELLIDPAALEALQMEREAEIESLSLYVKNLRAEANAIKAEEQSFADRRKAAENKADRLSNFLQGVLNGNPFKTSKVAISFRKSNAIEIDDSFIEWAMKNDSDMLRYKQPEADKKTIADALKAGKDIPFARIVQRTSMTIK